MSFPLTSASHMPPSYMSNQTYANPAGLTNRHDVTTVTAAGAGTASAQQSNVANDYYGVEQEMQRNVNSAGVVSSSDEVEVLPIGSGGEVGRSCVIVRFKGRTVMFDCGTHPAKSGLDSLPFFDSIECDKVDIVLITHFHLDHCGALPYFCNQTTFKGRIFMTSATKAFYKMVMNDFVRVGSGASDLVTSEWLQSTMNKIETVEYHEEVSVDGVRFQPFNAGHVLGAAMFMIDIAGMRALYTGDFSRVPDRHLLGAEIPPYSPDILIVESTNGIRELESREERERLFISGVHEVVKRGGRCLVPVFALGRAQELLLILEEYWEAHLELQHIPIYYASSLAQRCMKLYQTFVGAMNDRVKEQHAHHRNPFVFKYIRPLLDSRSLKDDGPCVVLASPGMLQSGISLELFEKWCGDRRNGIIVAGYCVDGTIAKEVLSKPREIVKADGRVLPLRMSTIEAVSFSAHSDGRQTRDFIQQLLKVQHTVLVHGNQGAMLQLKNKLSQDFKPRGMTVYTTINQESIHIPFALERSARIIGKLANTTLQPGSFVNGVMLVSGQHSYNIVHPDDIPVFTDLTVSEIQQAIILPLFTHTRASEIVEVMRRYFAESRMFATNEVHPQLITNSNKQNTRSGMNENENSNDSDNNNNNNNSKKDSNDTTERIAITREVWVEVQHDLQTRSTTLTILWFASHFNDMVADVTCIALINMSYADNKNRLMDADDADALLPVDVGGKDKIFRVKCFHHMLSQFYKHVSTNLITGVCIVILPDGQVAQITECIEVELQESKIYKVSDYNSPEVEKLKNTLKRIYLTLFPIPEDSGWCDCGMNHND